MNDRQSAPHTPWDIDRRRPVVRRRGTRRARIAVGVLLTAAVAALVVVLGHSDGLRRTRSSSAHWRRMLPAGSVLVATGPSGGTVWRVRIPNSFVTTNRPGYIYLPTYRTGARYPVVYLLHGFPGSPETFVRGSRIVAVADDLIRSGRLRPAIVVMPTAGRTIRYDGEWAGPWERYVVDDVLEWTQAYLPTIDSSAGRAIGGLSAGGFGAADIALRHPGLFGTIEAWGGYFHPLRDGPFAHATRTQLRASDPVSIVRRIAPLLHRWGVRVFLAAGRQDPRDVARAQHFGAELTRLRVENVLVLQPGAHHGNFWRRILPLGLAYTFPEPARTNRSNLQS
jgi:enterochelin esterase-like enzyme